MEMAATYIKNVAGGVFGMQIIDEVIIEGHASMSQLKLKQLSLKVLLKLPN